MTDNRDFKVADLSLADWGDKEIADSRNRNARANGLKKCLR
jgi:hypothetical protein